MPKSYSSNAHSRSIPASKTLKGNQNKCSIINITQRRQQQKHTQEAKEEYAEQSLLNAKVHPTKSRLKSLAGCQEKDWLITGHELLTVICHQKHTTKKGKIVSTVERERKKTLAYTACFHHNKTTMLLPWDITFHFTTEQSVPFYPKQKAAISWAFHHPAVIASVTACWSIVGLRGVVAMVAAPVTALTICRMRLIAVYFASCATPYQHTVPLQRAFHPQSGVRFMLPSAYHRNRIHFRWEELKTTLVCWCRM